MTTKDRSAATDDARVAEVYQYLERRPGSWPRELYLKGRNMTVGHLVYAMRVNKQTPEQAAEDYDLPLEQIHEALLYYQLHRDLIEQDVDDERRAAEADGIIIDPPLPR